MSYDFYVTADAGALPPGMDVHARVQSLATKQGSVQARQDHQNLLRKRDRRSSLYDEAVLQSLSLMRKVNLEAPSSPDLSTLPSHSFFVQFRFTLARPFISRDDETFHVMDNPVRKDKVFKVPMVSAASWKGNLRWTAMKADLWGAVKDDGNPVRDDPEEFARRRFRHTLLFGTEKGFETTGSSSDWTSFLDGLCGEGKADYRRLLRQQLGGTDDDPPPHLAGWLHFYPTFFDRIGLEVINPHDRQTRAGKQPIYFECAPIGARGTFSLLYVPLGHVADEQARQDLATVAKAISEMMLTYGFSAKKTSGYGEAEVGVDGRIWTVGGDWAIRNLQKLGQEVPNVQWA